MRKRKDAFRRKPHCHGHNSFSEELEELMGIKTPPSVIRDEQRCKFAAAIVSISTGYLFHATLISPGVMAYNISTRPGRGMFENHPNLDGMAWVIIDEMRQKLLPAPSFWARAGIRMMMGYVPGCDPYDYDQETKQDL